MRSISIYIVLGLTLCPCPIQANPSPPCAKNTAASDPPRSSPLHRPHSNATRRPNNWSQNGYIGEFLRVSNAAPCLPRGIYEFLMGPHVYPGGSTWPKRQFQATKTFSVTTGRGGRFGHSSCNVHYGTPHMYIYIYMYMGVCHNVLCTSCVQNDLPAR